MGSSQVEKVEVLCCEMTGACLSNTLSNNSGQSSPPIYRTADTANCTQCSRCQRQHTVYVWDRTDAKIDYILGKVSSRNISSHRPEFSICAGDDNYCWTKINSSNTGTRHRTKDDDRSIDDGMREEKKDEEKQTLANEIDNTSRDTKNVNNTNKDETDTASDAMKYTKEKLLQRCREDLGILLENFIEQTQAVSGELVQLLQERHELQEQVEMRRIAIEQLLRLQTENPNCQEINSIQMSVILPEGNQPR